MVSAQTTMNGKHGAEASERYLLLHLFSTPHLINSRELNFSSLLFLPFLNEYNTIC